MRVVGLLAGEDFFPWVELACDPQGFQIGHRSAAAEVTKKIFPPEHCGDFCHGFLFHGGGGAAAVQGVIVGVNEHR